MPALWEKTSNENSSSDLRKVDLASQNISAPTVIYLPGRDQVDNNPDELSKGIYFVNKLFADMPNPPKVYIWSQSNMNTQRGVKNLSFLFRSAAYSYFPEHVHFPAAKNLAKGVVMPLVTDADGKPLPFEQAQKNLRNLTLLGYCLGSLTAQEVYNASLKMMKKAGYAEEDAQKLLREIVLVAFASMTRPKREKDRYTTINFINHDDLFISIKNMLVLPVSSVVKLTRSFSTAARKLRINSLSDTSILVSAAARDRPINTIIGKETKEIIDDVKLPPWKVLITNHEAKDYVNDNDESSQFAGMVKFALHNAVTRTSTVRPIDLFDEPSIEEDTPVQRERYEDKISDGLLRATGAKWKRFLGLE